MSSGHAALTQIQNPKLVDPKILESSNPAEVDQELRFAGAESINLGLSYENPQGWYAGILMHSLISVRVTAID
ncbi:MAG: hypothetical protein AAF349_29080 [Cyanobacteria bacterium P01_A01_bin.68]